MSSSLDDLMGNAITEPIVDMENSVDVVVDVVDDRPEEDQVLPKDPVRSADFDPDEEIVEMGGRASKRIQQLRYEYHEERRAKESADKMREEAVKYAQQITSQNQELRDLLQRGEKILLSEIKTRTDAEMGNARDSYKSAYESGDTDALLNAQESLTRTQYDRERAESFGPLLPDHAYQDPRQIPPSQQPRPAPSIDPKLQEWIKNNSWFGQDEEMTSFAYGVHEKLVKKEGMDPRTESYYQKIDQRLREVFPGKFENGMGREGPAASSRASTVVAPAQRAGGVPRKVQLTSTQVALAKRLGISPEQYAKQLLKEMRYA